MDVVSLNEQLREEFACVVKRFIRYRRERVTQVAAAAQASALVATVGSATKNELLTPSTPVNEDESIKPQPEAEPQEEVRPEINEVSSGDPIVDNDGIVKDDGKGSTACVVDDTTVHSETASTEVITSDETNSVPSDESTNVSNESSTSITAPSTAGLLTPTSLTMLPSVSDSASTPTAESTTSNKPSLSTRIDHYLLHAQEILRRINLYQYTSRHQFATDLQTLQAFAIKPAERMMIEHLLQQQQGLARDAEIKAATASPSPLKRQRTCKINGTRLRPAVIPGIQELGKDSWACNLNLLGNNATIGVYPTRDEAVQGYERMRRETRENRWGVKALHKLAENMANGQEVMDTRVLQDALNQCKQHITTQRLKEFNCTLPQSEPVPIVVDKPPKPTKERIKSPPRQPAPSPPPVPDSQTLARINRRGKTPNDKTIGRLRLRRLLQMRLCEHVDGKEVVVRPSGTGVATEDSATWQATGRLEHGRVLYFKSQPKPSRLSFAEYVIAELGWTAAACDHMYLVDTRQSIDAHLLECDAFDATIRNVVERDFKIASNMWLNNRR